MLTQNSPKDKARPFPAEHFVGVHAGKLEVLASIRNFDIANGISVTFLRDNGIVVIEGVGDKSAIGAAQEV